MDREVIFEFFPVGNFMKVTAVDVATKIEVSTITPRNLNQDEQQQAAYNKLVYVIKRNLGWDDLKLALHEGEVLNAVRLHHHDAVFGG